MSRNIAPFGIRIPENLKETLMQCAETNKRSLNAELVARLEETTLQDGLYQSYMGYERVLPDLEQALEEIDKLQNKLEKEYNFDRFDAFKDEILTAIRESKN